MYRNNLHDKCKFTSRWVQRPGSFTSFIPEPKPLGPKEKKKKEKKEKKQEGFAEEKSKQPFKHLRDRVKRAFKSN
jgi:hypothetical protein